VKTIALIGEPATGKSSLAKRLIDCLSLGVPFKDGLIFGTLHKTESVFVLGQYSKESKFPGTDRFSMAVQPKAIEFLSKQAILMPRVTVFFEGDRLGTKTFLEYCEKNSQLRIVCLTASEELKAARHKTRGDSQTQSFLKGRSTKVSNLLAAFPSAVVRKNESEEDLRDNASFLAELIKR